jgi:hypothetical protein
VVIDEEFVQVVVDEWQLSGSRAVVEVTSLAVATRQVGDTMHSFRLKKNLKRKETLMTQEQAQ